MVTFGGRGEWVWRLWPRATGAVRLGAVILGLASGPALACAFDMVKPDKTAIDWIVGSENLVLARPKDDNPFAFDVTRVLVGQDKGPPINQLVDSVLRRKLAQHRSDAVLFAHRPEGGWQRVAYVDESFRDVLKTALDHRPAWRNGIPQSRLNFITDLQDSEEPAHKSILIGELDKVPYAELRNLDLRISDKELLRDLWTQSGYPYQAIRALLLGISGTPAARDEITGYIQRAADTGLTNNLGAFAAAYIELEGVSGVEYLAKSVLFDPDRPLDLIEQVVMAMSVHHGIGDQQLKASIQNKIETLVSLRPDAGVVVARQFSLRSDWSQSAVLEPLVRERAVALGDLLTISVYVARAREVGVGDGGGTYE